MKNILDKKSTLPNKPPLKPEFLFSSIHLDHVNRNNNYESSLGNIKVYNKLNEISRAKSAYHPKKIKNSECPAFRSTNYNKKLKVRIIEKENRKLGQRLDKKQSIYSINKFINFDKKNQKLRKMISKSKKMIHPSFGLLTPSEYADKIIKIKK